MVTKKPLSKYGKHERISDENLNRIKRIGKMGDTVNDVIGKLLDFYEEWQDKK